jgi:hypothetical protein
MDKMQDFGTINLTPEMLKGVTVELPEDWIQENLEQIQDNSEAIGAVNKVLNFISLTKARPRCEECGEWHDILGGGDTVAGLYQVVRALTQYSHLLASETRNGLPGRKESNPEAEGQ